MKHFFRHSVALAAAFALSAALPACAAPTSSDSDLAKAQAKAMVAQERMGLLDAKLFYEVLVGEMSAQQGDLPSAYALLLDAAQQTGHPDLFARATGIAMAARDGPAALMAVQAWRKAEPGSRDAARLELQVLAGMNQLGEMVTPIRDIIANSPDDEKASVILALPVVFARASDRQQAVTIVDQALEPALADPKTRSAAWVSKGRIRLLAGDETGAMGAIKEAEAADPGFDAAPILALELMTSRPEAEKVVRDYLARTPAVPVRLAYAKALMDAKRVDDAQKQLEQAVRDDARFADGWLLLGETQLMRKQFDAAEKSLQAYLQNADQPGPAGGTPRGVNAAALSLADLALRANRPDDARAALAKVSDQDATVGQQLRHAKLLADLGDEAAGAALLASLPDGTADERKEKVLATSQYLRETGHANRAYAMLRKLLAQRPTDTEVLYDTALAAEKAGDPATMERHLRRIIELEPKNYNAYNALGYSLADRNERLDEARQLIGKALELSPDSPHILDSMGWLEYRQGHLDKALELLQKAYAEFPDAEVAAHLGEVLWVRGDKAKAEAVWHEALQGDPKNDILLETLKRLRK